MSTTGLSKPELIDSATYKFLWSASNTQFISTPTISRHLAAALVANVPPGGMTSSTRRMHCKQCFALMHMVKVRLRKAAKRSAYGNKVRRMCTKCGHVNVAGGVTKGAKPERMEGGIVQELRQEMETCEPTEGKSAKSTEEPGVAKTPISKASKGVKTPRSKASSTKEKTLKTLSTGKRKNKRKSSTKTPNKKIDTPRRSGLAASFLFEPL